MPQILSQPPYDGGTDDSFSPDDPDAAGVDPDSDTSGHDMGDCDPLSWL